MHGQLILVAGLPGCGKTSYLCTMCRDGWLAFDDFKALAYENCSRFGSSRKLSALLAAIRADLNCIVADIDFCDEASRRDAEFILRAEVPGVHPRWEFFANDPAACLDNVKRRKSEGLDHDVRCIERYASGYQIPDGATVHPVWRKQDE
jgi:hypothetical protein